MPNIILLHGALGASVDLLSLSGALEQRGFTVFSFSFSGHGKTSFAERSDVEQYCDELEDFILAHNIGSTAVFGYSMGGYVALTLAAKHHVSIGKIITLGTKFNWSDIALEKELKQLNPELVEQKVPAFATSLREKHGDSWKELMHRTSGLMKNINQVQYLDVENLSKITVPVLIGLADRDQMVSHEETSAAFKSIPQAAMFMLPGTKHQFETVNVELLVRIISDFAG